MRGDILRKYICTYHYTHDLLINGSIRTFLHLLSRSVSSCTPCGWRACCPQLRLHLRRRSKSQRLLLLGSIFLSSLCQLRRPFPISDHSRRDPKKMTSSPQPPSVRRFRHRYTYVSKVFKVGACSKQMDSPQALPLLRRGLGSGLSIYFCSKTLKYFPAQRFDSDLFAERELHCGFERLAENK